MAYMNGNKILNANVILAEADYTLVSNVLKGNKSGETVVLDDISPFEHTLKVEAAGANSVTRRGKNLIPYPYTTGSRELNGITWTDNGDGTLTANGEAKGQSYITSKWFVLPKGTYTISGHVTSQLEKTCYPYIANRDNTKFYADQDGKGKTFTLEEDTEMRLVCSIMDTKVTDNHMFKPQLELGSVATEYEQYIEPIVYPVNEDGTVDGVKSIYPTTVLVGDTEGVTVAVEYNRDINKSLSEWRTIQHLTLTEDTNSIIFSADSEGKPFNLKKARLIIKGTATHARLDTFINKNEYVNPYFYSAMNANGFTNGILEIGEVTNGLRRLLWTKTGDGAAYVLADNYVLWAVSRNRYGENTPISHLKMNLNSEQYLLSGTELIFEGVDE